MQKESAGQAQQQPLGSIPENVQQPVTVEDLANMTAAEPGTPVSVNPATPSDHPENEPGQQNDAAEINLDKDQGDHEQGGTAATDLKLASEQAAMQGLYCYQVTAHAAAASLLCDFTATCPENGQWHDCAFRASKLITGNRYVRTFLWRRVAERAFRGTYFGRIPAEVHPAFIKDLLQISQAFAATACGPICLRQT